MFYLQVTQASQLYPHKVRVIATSSSDKLSAFLGSAREWREEASITLIICIISTATISTVRVVVVAIIIILVVVVVAVLAVFVQKVVTI